MLKCRPHNVVVHNINLSNKSTGKRGDHALEKLSVLRTNNNRKSRNTRVVDRTKYCVSRDFSNYSLTDLKKCVTHEKRYKNKLPIRKVNKYYYKEFQLN